MNRDAAFGSSAGCAPAAAGSSASAAVRSRMRIVHLPSSSDRIIASVHVMSTLSPTFTFASAALSSTRVLYFQLLGPVKVIDGTFMSIWVMVAVMTRWWAAVAAAWPAARVTDALLVSVDASPGRFTV